MAKPTSDSSSGHLRVRINPALKQRLMALADADKRTLSNYVIKILERESLLEVQRESAPHSAKPLPKKPRSGHGR